MIIKDAKFIKSSSNISECPQKDYPEFIFLGRSNVGKSSLINMLLGRKKLSKISSKPGKTQLINHFLINEDLYFVDLPGYGWAKTSKSNRQNWDIMTKNFLLKSDKLSLIFILIDIRIDPQKIDINYINYIGKNKLPLNIIFTKSDKINKSSIKESVESFLNELSNYWSPLPNYFISSSKTGVGREEILNYIHEITQR
ncbi:MAG: ribosome biogenesis GTP-binding protein YihA/YsxC [Bacteroidota bacterium]|nr:ribosome biogenesis GTP-binding protein YihA/YsxC [Bacteroidota bacterium]